MTADLAGLLTEAEHQASRMAGELYTFIAEAIVGHGPTREADLAELASAVHVIQRAVEAQGTARAYPGRYRLLGEVIARCGDPPDCPIRGVYVFRPSSRASGV